MATALTEAWDNVEKAIGEEEDDEDDQGGKEEDGKGEVGKCEVFLDESARVKVGENLETAVDDEERDHLEKGVDEKYGRNSRPMLLYSGHCLLTEQRH